ncbi:hypothetical protein [Dictyobacter arantiisoli]|uniref:hypothetical protein n=1 Tax=Dictyobacter arantiisoli TaxID=2014874 RepID=UPI00155A8BC1|nr:hypothetical protein [Dictyobacter arantiisoli]
MGISRINARACPASWPIGVFRQDRTDRPASRILGQIDTVTRRSPFAHYPKLM